MIEILRAWGAGTVADVRAYTLREFGWQPSGDELSMVLQFLASSELTKHPPGGTSSSYAATAAKARQIGPLALAKTYLFFRVPLVRPQRFLNATKGLAEIVLSRGMVFFLVFAGALGLFLAARQLDAFLAYAGRFFSLEGAAYYAVAIFFIKIIHELGHAWQATLRGVRVPVMGVAFMVMFPLLYSDVSDAWRTRNRRDRLMIDAGGVMMELGIAALATLLWVFLPDGPARSIAFAAATTSWVLSLAVNLNPFMRFDGYYFLSDAIGVQNLQPRAFALARWRLREGLFGLGDAPPEPFSKRMRRFLIAYAVVTWIYRFFLYLGIALLVYALFFKALGVLLLVVELTFFLGVPILAEVKTWFRMRSRIVKRPRFWISAACLGILIVLLFVPMRVTVKVPATLGFARETGVYPSQAAMLLENLAVEGKDVRAGEPIFVFTSTEMMRETQAAERRERLALLRFERRGATAQDRAQSLVLEQELRAARDRISGLTTAAGNLTIRAPFDGRLLDVNSSAKEGVWFDGRARLATLVEPEVLSISGYISEDDLARVSLDDRGRFIPEDPTLETVFAEISDIAGYTAKGLGRGYLSASNGGAIPVERSAENRSEAPFGAWFALTATLPEVAGARLSFRRPVRGVFVVKGRHESLFIRGFNQVARILLREFEV